MMTDASAFAGFGLMVAAVICGTDVSSVTVLVTVLDLPALSVAVIVIVFVPLYRLTACVNDPVPLTVGVYV